jgi:hypothetical protein
MEALTEVFVGIFDFSVSQPRGNVLALIVCMYNTSNLLMLVFDSGVMLFATPMDS